MNIYKHSAIALALVLSTAGYQAKAQQDDSKNIITVPEQLSDEQLMAWKKQLPTDGWLLLHFKEGDRIINLSHKEYVLHLRLNCAGNGTPGYLVEYSEAYRDGDYGGIDFVSSNSDNGQEVRFALDGKNYGNPFAPDKKQQFKDFATALKQAKQLTLSVYDTEMDPEGGKGEQKLNRAINFKLAHGALLDKPVNCGN